MATNEGSGAPDGGWGWLVVLASFLLQAISIGITYTFGVIYVEFMDYFKDTESATAWIGSIQPALLYLSGVVGGPLLKRFGWRAVTVSGSILSALGMWLSYLATSIYILYVTYGVLTGVGFGMMYVTSMVTVQHYFDKRRAMATGIAVSGSGVGTLCFGFFTQFLLDTYHWRLTLVIEGCIILVIGVCCGILFRPLSEANQEETDPLLAADKQTADNTDTYSTLSPSAGSSRVRSAASTPDSARSVHSTISTPPSTSKQDSSPVSDKSNSSRSWTHSLVKQLDYQGTPPLPDIIEDTRQHSEATVAVIEDNCCPCCDKDSLRRCDDKFKISLCRNPRLVMYCVTVTLFCFGYHVPYAYTPAKAIDACGLSAHKASFLVSSMGVSNVVFRLFIGWFGDRNVNVRFVLMGTVLFLCGVDSIISFLYTTFPMLLIYSSLFGALSGCFASLFPVVMVDLMGLEVIEYTLGLGMATSSLAFLVASPVSGWVIHTFGGYNIAFCMVGIIQVIGSVVFFLIRCLPPRYSPPPADLTDKNRTRRRTRYYSESIA